MDLSSLSHEFDKKKRECRAVVETPKGRRNKFDYDPDIEAFTLGGLLPEGLSFPFDFGFIPSTEAEDGDPLDIIVLMDEPAHVGCLLKIRIVGVFRVEQTEKGKTTQNDRLVGVAVRSFDYQDIEAVAQLPKPVIEQITEFLALYNKNSGKDDRVTGVEGPDQAIELLEKAIRRHQRKRT